MLEMTCVSLVVVPLRTPSRRGPPVRALANGATQMTSRPVAAITDRVRGARPSRLRVFEMSGWAD